MREQDSVRLLRECGSGAEMGIASIDQVLNRVSSDDFRSLLSDCKTEHEKLRGQIQAELCRRGDSGKGPGALAKGMSWLKTQASLGIDDSDQAVAELMTDGCNMGLKSLNRYLNQYSAADQASKSMAQSLCGLEEKLLKDMRGYL